jgi:signal transduction histidine kinase
VLRQAKILDTAPEESFDRLTRLASQLFETPIALVSLVDDTRQWFKSRQGVPATETPRDSAFCAYAILGDSALVVPDATRDSRFVDNPLVVGQPNIRFYAGAPVATRDGHRLGTLCVIDHKPRGHLTGWETAILRDLAAVAAAEIDLRLAGRGLAAEVEARGKVLSQLEAAHQAVRAAYQTKSDFIARMSHDFRGPLSAIIGFADLLESPEPETTVREWGGYIREAASHLLGLTNDILEFSRAEAGRLELRLEPVDGPALLGECLRIVQGRAAKRQIALSLVEQSPRPFYADPLRLRQVVLNLLENAVKFTPEGGQIVATIGSGTSGETLISVSDTGIGIAPEDTAKALAPFGQVNPHTAAGRAGSGLGLSIAKSLIEQHGGRLELESAVGQGTTVKLVIPRRADPPAGR